MGNCIRRDESSMVWAGDDWGSMHGVVANSLSPKAPMELNNTVKQTLLFDHNNIHHHHDHPNIGSLSSTSSSTSSSSSSSKSNSNSNNNQVVKIKITKKQLEELLGGRSPSLLLDSTHNHHDHMDVGVDQLLLSKLMMISSSSADNDHDHFNNIHDEHQRSWRPVLQSIPEVM